MEPQKSVVEWKLRRLLRGLVVLITSFRLATLLARSLIRCVVASSKCEQVVDTANGGRITWLTATIFAKTRVHKPR